MDPDFPDEYGIQQSFLLEARQRHLEVAEIYLSMIDVDDLVRSSQPLLVLDLRTK